MFSKYVLFKKGHLNRRAGFWTPPGSATAAVAAAAGRSHAGPGDPSIGMHDMAAPASVSISHLARPPGRAFHYRVRSSPSVDRFPAAAPASSSARALAAVTTAMPHGRPHVGANGVS